MPVVRSSSSTRAVPLQQHPSSTCSDSSSTCSDELQDAGAVDIAAYQRQCLYVFSQLMQRARKAASIYADDRHALCFFQRHLVQAARSGFSEFVDGGCESDVVDATLFVSLCKHVAQAVYVRPQLAYEGPAISDTERLANRAEMSDIVRVFFDSGEEATGGGSPSGLEEGGDAEQIVSVASPSSHSDVRPCVTNGGWRLSDSDVEDQRSHEPSDVSSMSDACCSEDNSDFVEDVIQAELMQIDARALPQIVK